MAAIGQQQKDEALTQFLSMTEDRVDPDVAQSLLEALDWNLAAAMEQLYGGDAVSRPATATAISAAPVPGRSDEDDVFIDPGDLEIPPEHHQTGGGFPAQGLPGLLHGAHVDHVDGQTEEDPMISAAIAASYSANTEAGRAANEDDLLMQALRASQAEEDARQRQALREQQEAELAESILMDQMREQGEQERQDAERAVEQAEAMEEAAKVEEKKMQALELEAKRAALPEEPPAGEPGRLALMVRLPNGQRLQRAFRASEKMAVVYDFVDLQGGEELASQRYRLLSNMPRKTYEDRQQTLAEAGIQNQFVLMVELLSGL